MISLTLEQVRIEKAMRDAPTGILSTSECILKALKHSPNAVVAWSGGKCSTAVLHKAIEIKPDIQVIFNDTGVEFPETYIFVDKLTKAWNLNLRVLKPTTTFWSCVEQFGFPMLRGQYKDSSRSKDGRPMCCQLLKEQPVLEAGIDVCITGLRACESRMRMFAIAQRGQYYYAKTLKRWNFHPIAFWSTSELDTYCEMHEIPLNPIYQMGHSRCGCWPCTGYLDWKKSLATSHPKMYRMIARMKGEPTLWEYADIDTCHQGLPNNGILSQV